MSFGKWSILAEFFEFLREIQSKSSHFEFLEIGLFVFVFVRVQYFRPE